MQTEIDPIKETQTVIEWLTANPDGVMYGAIVATAIVGVLIVLRYFGKKVVHHECSEGRFGWKGVIGSVLSKTTILFMVAAALDIVASYSEPPERLQHIIDIFFVIMFAIQGAIWARELVLSLIATKVDTDDGPAGLGNASAVIRVLVSVALFALAIIVILDNLGVNVTALVAGLGIGGIAIGLAAQGIFSDLFAALAILIDKPFRRGDTVRYGNTTGTVEQIGLKTTRIRAQSGEQVIMSNRQLLDQEIFNIAKSRARRVWLKFGVIYQTTVEQIDEIKHIAEEAVKPHKRCRLVRCVMTEFGDSSLNFDLVYDDKAIDFDTLAKHKSDILVFLFRSFNERGIEFAYPTQTTFTAAPDGRMIMPYPTVQPVAQMSEKDAINAIEAAAPKRPRSRGKTKA